MNNSDIKDFIENNREQFPIGLEMRPMNVSSMILKPSQNEIYLKKTMDMVLDGICGGDLGAVISKDGRILDGHHRWAASMISDPTSRLSGFMINMDMNDCIDFMNLITDFLGNSRKDGNGDINLYKCSLDDIINCINNRRYKPVLDNIGTDEVIKRILKIKSIKPHANAVSKAQMPVIEPEQIETINNIIDMKKYIPTFESFLNRSNVPINKSEDFVDRSELEAYGQEVSSYLSKMGYKINGSDVRKYGTQKQEAEFVYTNNSGDNISVYIGQIRDGRYVGDIYFQVVVADESGALNKYFFDKSYPSVDELKKDLIKNNLNELINEGQISITELNPTDQKQIKQLENILDGKLDTIYSGGGQHGRFVVSIKLSNNYTIYEFTPVVMKKILKFNIKYVSGGYGLVNIAFN